ncbi:MAG: Ig-like domain-containing protein, partial [Planctomycetota bacterium]
WASSDPTVASVDTNGQVTGVAVGGPVTISARAGNTVGATLVTVFRPSANDLSFSVEPSDVAAGIAIAPAVEVTVLDSLGNRVQGDTTTVSLALGANPGGSTLGGTVVVAAVDGVAQFPGLTLDKAGTGNTVVASAPGITPVSSAPFDVSPGVAVGFTFAVQPASTQAGALITAVVHVVDAFGNTVTVSNDAIDIRIRTNPSGGTLSGTTTVVAVQGVATFLDLRIDKVGVGYTLEAGSAGRTPAASNPFDITAAAPTTLAFTVQPADVLAGDSITPPVQVTVVDPLGNRIPGDTRTVTISLGLNPAGSTLGGTLAVSAVDGVATFPDLTLDQAGSGYTLVASAPGITPASSDAFAVSPGVAVGFAFLVQPASTEAGGLIMPTVHVVDAFGNTVTLSNEAIDIVIGSNPGGGTLSGTTTVFAVQGVAVFSDLSIDKVGAGYTFEAGSAGRIPATSDPFDITAGPPVALAFLVQPSTEDHNKPIKPPVEVGVMDGFGNLVDTATVSITMTIAVNPGGSVLSGTTTQSAVNGVAVFDDLRLDKNGTGYVLAADAPGLAGALSVPFRIK